MLTRQKKSFRMLLNLIDEDVTISLGFVAILQTTDGLTFYRKTNAMVTSYLWLFLCR